MADKSKIIIVMLFGALISCASSVRVYHGDVIESDRLRTHVRILASDSLGGREAGTMYERMAQDYIVRQLESYGVQPYAYRNGGSILDSLTYIQSVEAAKIRVMSGSGIILRDADGQRMPFYYGNDFGNFHGYLFNCSVTAPVVFAGYGITAPEFDYDDYAGLDVKGKIVLVLDDEPPSDDENYFYGEIPSSYASALFYKRHRAKELGAAGIIVMAPEALRRKWSDYVDYFKSAHLTFDKEIGVSRSVEDRIPYLMANEFFFRKILSRAGLNLDSIESGAKTRRPFPRTMLPSMTMELTISLQRTLIETANLIGVLEGADETLRHEYVGVCAHYDHLGISESGEVYNGADDNASGVAAVLEIARAVSVGKRPKRSVLFVFHGAEEKGLIGSDYLTQPETMRPFHLTQLVTMINIDMVGRGHTDSLYVIGAGRISSELKSIQESVNRKAQLFHLDYYFDRADDPNYYYYRSDHYHYAKEGVPVVFYFDGMVEDYHKTTDDADRINWDKLRNVAQFNYNLVMELANRGKRPKIDRFSE